MKLGECNPTVMSQYLPLSGFCLFAIQDAFTLGFEIKLKSKRKKLGVICGENDN